MTLTKRDRLILEALHQVLENQKVIIQAIAHTAAQKGPFAEEQHYRVAATLVKDTDQITTQIREVL